MAERRCMIEAQVFSPTVERRHARRLGVFSDRVARNALGSECGHGDARIVDVFGDHISRTPKDAPRRCRAERDLAVANGAQTVHPTGHAISHSTHVGFKLPPT